MGADEIDNPNASCASDLTTFPQSRYKRPIPESILAKLRRRNFVQRAEVEDVLKDRIMVLGDEHVAHTQLAYWIFPTLASEISNSLAIGARGKLLTKEYMMTNDLTENIERLMQDRGWSMNELARRAGMGQTAVYDIIRGRVVSPRLDSIEKLANALEVEVIDLLLQGSRGEAEKKILAAFDLLSPDDKDRLIQTATAWASRR